MPLISAAEERELIETVLAASDVPAGEARAQAEQLLEADLRGHPSHGLQRLPVIVGRLRSKVIVARPVVTFDWFTPSAGVIDGGRGLGPVVANCAVEALAERASASGLAALAIRNANHVGILAPYLEPMAARGLIGIASTTSEPLVHPWGGRRAMLGTNPIAIAIPARPTAFVLDMATGVVSMGKILAFGAAGRSLPEGWALDADGASTTDALRAASGAIAPFGGAKGYALGLALELLVAGLSGTALGRQVVGTLDAELPCTKGDLFLAIDPHAFGADDLAERISPFLDALRDMPSDTDRGMVRVPGDRAREERERRLAAGIEHSDATLQKANALREKLISQ